MASSAQADSGPTEHVVLLHGLARTPRAMRALEVALGKQGFRVHNIAYPSTRLDFDALVDLVNEKVQYCCSDGAPINFVSYSLGGLLVRGLADRYPPQNMGRVVMIAPPNKGSAIVDTLGNYSFFKWFYGPVGPRLGTREGAIVASLKAVEFECGVIAGNRVINPLSLLFLPSAHDGSVTVESAKIEGMSDFVVLAHSHTFIQSADDTIEQVIHFLDKGLFIKK